MQRSLIPEWDRAPRHAQSTQPAPASHFPSLLARTPNHTDLKAGAKPELATALLSLPRLNSEHLKQEPGDGPRPPEAIPSLPARTRTQPDRTVEERPEPRPSQFGCSDWDVS
jgi:hypothetical protein